MATAVGTPVVGLYATSNRHRTGPYFSQHLVVDKYPEAVAREFGRPIETLRWGQRVRDPAAMSLITVADVTAKLDLAFAERGIAPVHLIPSRGTRPWTGINLRSFDDATPSEIEDAMERAEVVFFDRCPVELPSEADLEFMRQGCRVSSR